MISNKSENKGYKTYLEEDGGRKGIFKWILSTDHKRIALLYLYSMMGWFTMKSGTNSFYSLLTGFGSSDMTGAGMASHPFPRLHSQTLRT